MEFAPSGTRVDHFGNTRGDRWETNQTHQQREVSDRDNFWLPEGPIDLDVRFRTDLPLPTGFRWARMFRCFSLRWAAHWVSVNHFINYAGFGRHAGVGGEGSGPGPAPAVIGLQCMCAL